MIVVALFVGLGVKATGAVVFALGLVMEPSASATMAVVLCGLKNASNAVN